MIVHMLSMDKNYYEYFIKYGQDPEFSNLLIGSGGSGGGYGLDNGIGFFGSRHRPCVYHGGALNRIRISL